jgi:hypothetical protein
MEIKLDFTALINLSKDVEQTPKELAQLAIGVVNIVAVKAFNESKELTLAKVNLSPEHVNANYRLESATTATGAATITASGRGISLLDFNPQTVSVRASSRAKGRNGVPAGYKQAGVTVDVKSVGSNGLIEHGFFLNVKSGLGIFTRSRTGKIQKRYGPSEDQVFSNTIPEITPNIENSLETEALKAFNNLRIAI